MEQLAFEMYRKDPSNQELHVMYFYIALGKAKLGDLVEAKSGVDRMLALSPNNHQGRALSAYIDQRMKKDAMLALAGGAAVVGGIVAFASLAAGLSRLRR